MEIYKIKNVSGGPISINGVLFNDGETREAFYDTTIYSNFAGDLLEFVTKDDVEIYDKDELLILGNDRYLAVDKAANYVASLGDDNFGSLLGVDSKPKDIFVIEDSITGTTGVSNSVPSSLAVSEYVQQNPGSKGDTGAQGLPGETGLQGSDGNDGSVGAQGDTGLQGLQGYAGADGSDGSDGSDGVQGQTGIQGLSGNDGDQGQTGIQGLPGNNGTQGQTGIQGLPGNDGSNGSDGNDGLQGETGLQGNGGLAGIQGTTGIQGETGNDGSQGIQGETGLQGSDGNDGLVGSQGETGIQGNDGADGSVGSTGSTGSTGLQGDTGIPGMAGDGGGIFVVSGERNASVTPGVHYAFGNGSSAALNAIVISYQCTLDALSFHVSTSVTSDSEIEVYINESSSGITLGLLNGQMKSYRTGIGHNINPGDSVSIRINSGSGGSQTTASMSFLTGGIKGETGIQGITGLQGNDGSGGSQGIQGGTGIQGIPGDDGSDGAVGATGIQGITGASSSGSSPFLELIRTSMIGQASNTQGYFSIQGGNANPFGLPVTRNQSYKDGSLCPVQMPYGWELSGVSTTFSGVAVQQSSVGSDPKFRLDFYKHASTSRTLIGTVYVPVDPAKCSIFNNLGNDQFQTTGLTGPQGITGSSGDLIGWEFVNETSSNNQISSLSRISMSLAFEEI